MTGGLSGNGTTRAAAIQFISGVNTLELDGNGGTLGQTYATITGNVVANGTSNTLKLSGAGGTFDLSKLDAATGGSAQFQGFGAVQVNSTGTWVTTGTQGGSSTNTWTVNSGTLQLGTASTPGLIRGDVMIGSGATFANGPSTSTITGQISANGTIALQAVPNASALTTGTFGLSSSATLAVTLGAPTTTALITATGSLSYNGTLSINGNSSFSDGTYRLVSYGGSVNFSNGFSTITGPSDYSYTTTLDATNKLLILQVTSQSLYWNGATTSGGTGPVAGGTGTWTAAAGGNTNWTNAAGTSNVVSDATKTAVFAGTAGVVTVNAIQGAVSARGLKFLTSGYTIAGAPVSLVTTSGAPQINVVGATTLATISAPLAGTQGLEKIGTGTLLLSGPSFTSGDVTVTAGTLAVTGGQAIADTSTVTVANGGTFDVRTDQTVGAIAGAGAILLDGAALTTGGNNASTTFAGALSGTGSLTKAGTGTLTLSGANTYTGTTQVAGGTLAIAGSVGGDVYVQNQASLSGSGSVGGTVHVLAGGTLAGSPGNGLTMAGLALAPAATLAVSLGTPGGAGVFQVNGNVALGGTLAVTATPGFGLGVYRIANYTGQLTGTGMAVAGLGSSFVGGVQTSIASQVNLVVDTANNPVTFWNGANTGPTPGILGGGGTWSADARTNWTDASGTIPRTASAGFAVFQGSPGTVTVDDTAGAVSATGLQFATSGYTVAGGAITLLGSGSASVRVGDGSAAGAATVATITADLAGTAGLEKTDLGTLILTGAKSYTGGTTITAGTLQLGDGTTSGSVQGDILDNAALVVSPGGNQTYAGAISGSGSLTKTGSGTLTLTGASTYTGATTVAGGTLAVNGSLAAASAVSVLSGGTLGGSGTVGGVTVYAGGTIAGLQGQTLTTGDLTVNAGGHVAATLTGTGSGALINVQGNLVLNGVLDPATTAGSFGAGLYRIISYTGTLSGNGLSLGTITGSVNVPDLAVQTDTGTKTVNLITNPTTASYWNAGQPGSGAVQGGNGTWTANTIWTNVRGANSAQILAQATAIFAGAPGTVTVDTGAGTVVIGGMQFATSGYTVQGGAITLVNAQTNVRVGDGTTAGAATTAIIASTLAGAGGLVKNDYGTLTLTGANTYTGGTAVTAGTLALGNAAALGTGALSLNEGTTLAFTGNMTLATPISFPQLGDPIIDTGANAVTIAGPISGLGDLSKIGSGSLTLTGANTYTGATDVVAGSLVVTGSIAASSGITVESGAILGGSGTVPGLTALAGSTVAPGVATPFSTLNVAGNVSFAAGSTFRVQIDAAGRTDALAASGTASLAGGTVDVRAGSGTYAASTTYRILSAAGGRTGQFSNLTTTTNLAFLAPYLSYDPSGVSLAFTRATDTGPGGTGGGTPVSFASVAGTANQRAAAAAVDALGSGRLFNAVLSQSAAGARQAFDAVSGEVHAGALTAGIEDSRVVREAILGRLQDGAPASALWGTGFGDFGRNGGNGNAAALKRSVGGFVLGADTRVDLAGFQGWRIGVAGGYTDDTLSVGARSSRGDLKTFFGGVYAGLLTGPLDVKLGMLGGGTQVTTQRSVLFPAFTDATRARDDGSIVQGFGEVGYRIALPAGTGAQGFVAPVFQGAAIRIDQDGVRESGGAAALRVYGHGAQVATTTLGLRGEVTLAADWPLLMRGLVGWRHAFGDVDPRALVAFAGGTPFAVAGAPIDRDAVVAEVGLDYRASAAVTLGVSYLAQKGARASDQGVKGRFEYRF